MRAAMVLMSAICIGIGIFPALLYRLLPYPGRFRSLYGTHVVSQLQLLLFSGLAFFLLLGWLKRTETITLDIDWLWRRPARWSVRGFDSGSDRARQGLGFATDAAGSGSIRSARSIATTARRAFLPAPGRPEAWRFWAVFLLGAYLIFYYF